MDPSWNQKSGCCIGVAIVSVSMFRKKVLVVEEQRQGRAQKYKHGGSEGDDAT
jgi:hypothetical protein